MPSSSPYLLLILSPYTFQTLEKLAPHIFTGDDDDDEGGDDKEEGKEEEDDGK